ncbi:hypothetical protein BTHE68_57310 (plasmid) [Burkholderia sp. THE68]|uniref:DUF485 domain-containing protein n=1 Tax=Burkholderia sp. THE68 TaxID=758782 RepID=UPI0013174F26|nr:DUF485 domain-containing protein [Burkholderia sp. THE68]BBU31997.1 hypothetical protein BTHE68_57310 [Burkholderia sp. THE68]
MQQVHIDRTAASPAYHRLVAQRRRFSLTLTALMILTYYGFVLFVALAPHLLARPLYTGATMTVGVVAGVAVILVALGMTACYVLRANRTFDPSMSALLASVQQGD